MILHIFLLLIASSFQLQPLITREFLDKLRNEVDWEVTDYEENIFKGWTLEEFQETFGGIEIPEVTPSTEEEEVGDLPENFDGRKKWPKCIHPIRTQGRCGSCWAFGVVGSTSDRFCIAGKDVLLSPQDLVSCDKSNHGCKGGGVVRALEYMVLRGAVSEACFPYTSAGGTAPLCRKTCKGSEKWVKHHCKQGTIKTITGIPAMKLDIMTHGSVVTAFKHYADFNAYKGGIYHHKSGAFVSGHIMKPIGWGVEKGVNYWIIANTYGDHWGEKGYVRFKMNDCGINNAMFSCLPHV